MFPIPHLLSPSSHVFATETAITLPMGNVASISSAALNAVIKQLCPLAVRPVSESHVLGLVCVKDEIGMIVIALIEVLVVNHFFGRQIPPDSFFHHQARAKHVTMFRFERMVG